MKIFVKVPVKITKESLTYLNSEGLSLKTNEEFELDGNLFVLPFEYNGVVQEVKTSREDISGILNKIEKYQSGKMSDKEVAKMINKIKDDAHLQEVVNKMQQQSPLSPEDLAQLTTSQTQTQYEFDYHQMKLNLDDDFIVELIDFKLLVPSQNYQTELSELFLIQKEAKKQEERAIVAKILGTKPKQKTVVDYLTEKKVQISENKPVIFSSDSLISLPQANDLERVLDWGQSIYDSVQEQLDLSVLENDHHQRDVGYYSHALKYLGLVFTDDKSLCLTYAGEAFFTHDRTAQKAIILDILTKDPLICAVFNNPNDIEGLIPDFNARGLSGETIKRRVSCLLSWKNYLVN